MPKTLCQSSGRPTVHVAWALGLLVATVAMTGQAMAAGIFDRLKGKLGEIGDKIRQNDRRCVDCGKVILMGDRCAVCQAKVIAKKLERRCVDCGAVIHVGDRCVACVAKKMEHHCAGCGKVIHIGEKCATCKAKELTAAVRPAATRLTGEIVEAWNRNKGHWQEKAAAGFDAAMQRLRGLSADPGKQGDLWRKLVACKRNLELTAIRSCPAVDPETGSIVTLDTLMRKVVRDAGVGGSLGEDPIGAAYMMMVDSDYLFNCVLLVQDPTGGYITLNEAVASAGGLAGAFDRNALHRASESYSQMRNAYSTEDGVRMNDALRDFTASVAALNGREVTRTVDRADPHPQVGSSGPVPPRPAGEAVPHLQNEHSAFWATIDLGLVATINWFGDLHRGLTGFFGGLGAGRDASSWLATISLVLGCLLALVILWSIPRMSLKRRLRAAERELDSLRGSHTGAAGAGRRFGSSAPGVAPGAGERPKP